METDRNESGRHYAVVGLMSLWVSRFDKFLLRLAKIALCAAVLAQFVTKFPQIRIAADKATSGFSFTKTLPVTPRDSVRVTLFLAPSQRTKGVAAFVESRRVGDFSHGPSLNIESKAGEQIRIVNDTPYLYMVTSTVSSDLQKDEILARRLVLSRTQTIFPPVRGQQVPTLER